MTPIDILRATRERISAPHRWTQGVVARDHTRQFEVEATDPTARCWCLEGAVARECDGMGDDYEEAIAILDRTLNEGRSQLEPPMAVHDSTTHERVLELVDRAIARLLGERMKEVKAQ